MKRFAVYLPAVGVFCLALFVRVLYNLTVARRYIPEYDAGIYNDIASRLLHQHCFCETARAPLWPYIISFIYAALGTQNIYPRLFFSLLGSGTCVVVYLFARDLFGKRTALIAGILASIYTGLFIYDGWLYTESLYTFLLTVFLYALFRLQSSSQHPENMEKQGPLSGWLRQLTFNTRIAWMLLSGVCLGLATLTRPNGVFLFGIVVVWAGIVVLLKIVPWQTAVEGMLVIMFVGAALIAPWTYRNYKATHTFLLVASGSGLVLSGSYNDTVLKDNRVGKGMWMPLDLVSPPIDFHGHNCCDYTGEADNTQYALHWIQTHINDMPYLLSLHFINMWTPYTSEDGLPMREFPTRLSSHVVWDMMWIMSPLVFLFAALGLLATWRRWKKQFLVLYLVIILTVLQNVVFYGSSRFRAPIEPMLVVLVGGAVWWLVYNETGIVHTLLKKKAAQGTPASQATPANKQHAEV